MGPSAHTHSTHTHTHREREREREIGSFGFFFYFKNNNNNKKQKGFLTVKAASSADFDGCACCTGTLIEKKRNRVFFCWF